MVDFKLLLLRFASCAAVILLLAQLLDVVEGVEAAVLGFASASIVLVKNLAFSPVSDVGIPPSLVAREDFWPMFLAIALVYFLLFMGMLLAVGLLCRSHIARPSVMPAFGAREGALYAIPVRYEPAARMTIATWFSAFVMAVAAFFGCGPLRRHLSAGVKSVGSIPPALHAASVMCPPFGKMAVRARLTNFVEALTCGLGGKSFWHRLSHTHTLTISA